MNTFRLISPKIPDLQEPNQPEPRKWVFFMWVFTVPEGLLNILKKTCQYYCLFKVNLLLSVQQS